MAPGDRDRPERADDPGELGADQHRGEDDERRELHRAPVDQRLEHVVLELLVHEEEDTDDEADDPPLRDRRNGHEDDGRDGRSCERDEIEHPGHECERHRVRDAGREQDHERADERDEADQQVARDVAPDRLVDAMSHALPAGPRALGEEVRRSTGADVGRR